MELLILTQNRMLILILTQNQILPLNRMQILNRMQMNQVLVYELVYEVLD